MTRFVITAPRVITCDPARATEADALGVIEQGAVLVEGDTIAAVGTAVEISDRAGDAQVMAHDGLLTPGLVDAHTHAPFTGSRHIEYALRMAGAGYEEIAAAGGGIVSTMRAVRAAEATALTHELEWRAKRMHDHGVTTIECKSGYGLDLANERKQLEAVARASIAWPRLVPTYLALHALPPEANGDGDAYAERVAREWLPEIATAKLARFVDAYVDRGAFTVEQARLVLSRAKELGLGVRVHAGQFADVGAAELAAELGAASADHLEHVGERGLEAMAAAGVRAVLLPVASFTLKQEPPPIDAMRRAGVRLVVASDANPGTAPTESLPLAIALAVRSYGLTVAEALLGATREAAASLGLEHVCGALRPGLSGDFAMWNLPHEAAIVQPWGVWPVRAIIAKMAAYVFDLRSEL
jgi:imidazolonepropionase